MDQDVPEVHKLRILVFVERIELIVWLEGASDEEGGSEIFITAGVRLVKVINARLQEIQWGEEDGDLNTILSGIKPT